MRGQATALVGAQYGSEGKGLVAAALAGSFNCHVRVGGPNAGHTFYHGDNKFVARSIPCGWVNPEAQLFVGPGAVIDLAVLVEELAIIEDYGYSLEGRLAVDYRAVLISQAQHLGEGGVRGSAHQQIGSTGEGVGLARMSKLNRDTLIATDNAPYSCLRVQDRRDEFGKLGIMVDDVAAMLQSSIAGGANVLLEGTQGHGLSMTLGPWPYVTSADTNAAQLASDSGISPSDVKETILVARTCPIRVAGTSGPLWGETTWEELGQEPEITTVTKKVRRVGTWNVDQVADAARTNHPARIVVTFLDYLFPDSRDVVNWRALPAAALGWLSAQEELLGAMIVGVGTGPRSYCPISTLSRVIEQIEVRA